MKRFSALILCLVLAFSLAGCGKQPAASAPGPEASSQKIPVSSASSESASRPAASSEVSSSSAPETSVSEEDPSEKWPRSFVSMPVTLPDGSDGEKALLVLRAPEEWVFNNYTTFSVDDLKIAEVARILPAGTKDAPFTDAMEEPYLDNSFYPEGFGLVSTQNSVLNGHNARILNMKMWPDDAEEPIYPFYIFYQIGDYVIDIHLYTGKEGDTMPDALSCAVLNSMELHFSDEDEEFSDADSSSSADTAASSAASASSSSSEASAVG